MPPLIPRATFFGLGLSVKREGSGRGDLREIKDQCNIAEMTVQRRSTQSLLQSGTFLPIFQLKLRGVKPMSDNRLVRIAIILALVLSATASALGQTSKN